MRRCELGDHASSLLKLGGGRQHVGAEADEALAGRVAAGVCVDAAFFERHGGGGRVVVGDEQIRAARLDRSHGHAVFVQKGFERRLLLTVVRNEPINADAGRELGPGERLVRGVYKTLKYVHDPAQRFENFTYAYGQLGYLGSVLRYLAKPYKSVKSSA